jgi:hypothetical protein
MKMLKPVIMLLLACLAVPATATAQDGTTLTSAETQRRGKKAEKTAGDSADPAKAAGPVLRRSNRMEFDGRLIKGERASGAVYLFQRVPRRLPPLLKLERDELDRIVWPVLRRNADRPVSAKPAPKAAPKVEVKKTKKRVKKRSWKKKPKWRSKRRWKTKQGTKKKK